MSVYRLIANVQDCEQLQKDIDHLTSWAKKWYMRFESSKCKIMRITRKTTHKITYQYTMERTSLESVHHTKYLGVTISDDLRWNRHVADITGCANKLLGPLRRNLSICDRRVKEAAYPGLVRPLPEYASQAWDPYTDNLSNEIWHSDFASLESVFTLVFYFLNSTLLFDLARVTFSTRFIELHLPSRISNSSKIFNTTSEFSFTLH